jgi:hypothetical protein
VIGRLHFGGARLPNGPITLTKELVCFVPASGYAKTSAEARSIVCYVEMGHSVYRLRVNQESSDAADPWLGTRMDLAQRWDSPAPVASLKSLRPFGSLAPPNLGPPLTN